MSAHLRCSRCGRQSYLDLHVTLTDDNVALCDGEDCEQGASGLRAAPTRGIGRASLAAAAVPMAGPRRSGLPMPKASTPSDRTPDDPTIVPNRIRRAEEKRARRAEKRRRSA